MADIRINALATTAASTASDDFIAVDGSANGTRKLNAFSPTFGGNLTVSGTGTSTFGGILNVGGSFASPTSANTSLNLNTTTANWEIGRNATAGGFYIYGYGGAGYALKLADATGNATLAGNLTVSGTGTSDFSGNVRLANTKAIYGYTFAGATGSLISSSASDNLNVGQNNANWAALNLFGGTGNVDVYSGATGFVARFNTSGNLLLGTTTDGGQKLQVNGTAAISGGIVGTTTNDNAAAGIVGEYVSSTVGAGSAITLTTATAANLTNITLTPGDWDVVFVPHFWGAGGSVTGTQCVSSLSTTSATLDTTPDRLAQFPSVPTSSADLTVAIPATRFSVTSSTIIYGVVRSTFTVGTNKVYGVLSARRVR